MNMSAPATVLPLSRWSVLRTEDPERACAHLCSLFRPHRIELDRRRPAIRFRHNRAELGGVSVNSLRYGAAVTVNAPNAADSYLIKLTLRGWSRVAQGRAAFDTRAGDVCVLNPTRPLLDRMSPDFEMLIVQIDGTRLRAALSALLGASLRAPLEFLPAAWPSSGAVASFAHMVATVCADLERARPALTRPAVSAPLQQTLMNLVLSEIPHSYSGRLATAPAATAPAFLRRVEDYVHAHLREPLALDDLCAVAGTSARTLQAAFERHRSSTPMRYLRDARLSLARRELVTAAARGLTVTEVALACGFTHLGKFALQYRRRYGESPSVTRARGAAWGSE